MCFVCVANQTPTGAHAQHIQTSMGVADSSRTIGTAAFTTAPDYTLALLQGYSWTGTFNQAATVGYTFEGGFVGDGYKNALVTQRIAIDAMNQWENVANIDFVSGNSNSALQYTTAVLPEDESGEILGVAYTFSTGEVISEVEVQIDVDYATDQILPGKTGYQTMLHEIGHALGLKHPFDETSGTGTTLDGEFDSFDYTLMSYTPGANVTTYNAITPTLEQWGWLAIIGWLGWSQQVAVAAALSKVPYTTVIPLNFAQLVFVSIIAYVFYNELVDSWTVAGSIIIIAGTLYNAYNSTRSKNPPPVPEM